LARRLFSESPHAEEIQPSSSIRCRAGKSDPGFTTKVLLEICWILREIPYPCISKSGISWAEELTGLCHLTGRGLLIDTRIRDDSERKDRSAVQAKLRARSGLVVESILTFFRHEPILIKTIAARAKVSPALAFRVLWRLSRLNLLEVHGS
jgi:hypothetical protein